VTCRIHWGNRLALHPQSGEVWSRAPDSPCLHAGYLTYTCGIREFLTKRLALAQR
jgi:hypothetical protein